MTITNHYIYYDVWEWISPQDVMDTIKKNPYRAVIFDGLKEHTPFWGYHKRYLYELAGILDATNTKLYCLCSAKNNYNPDFPDLLHKYVEFVNVPLFWLHMTNLGLKYKNYSKKIDKNVKSHFFSLINKPHNHRCSLVDSLYKYDCFKYGNHTWNEINESYHFEHWKQKVILSNDEYSQTKDNYLINDQAYRSSVIDLVMESTTDCIFYSEKTFKCILTQKPFILFGDRNINLQLKDFGFKLFDSTINYSFDEIENEKQRAEALSIELKRICEKYSPVELQSKLIETCQYNAQHANTLLMNQRQYFPKTYFDIEKLLSHTYLQQKVDLNFFN